jgi:hypothetical protein
MDATSELQEQVKRAWLTAHAGRGMGVTASRATRQYRANAVKCYLLFSIASSGKAA